MSERASGRTHCMHTLGISLEVRTLFVGALSVTPCNSGNFKSSITLQRSSARQSTKRHLGSATWHRGWTGSRICGGILLPWCANLKIPIPQRPCRGITDPGSTISIGVVVKLQPRIIGIHLSESIGVLHKSKMFSTEFMPASKGMQTTRHRELGL